MSSSSANTSRATPHVKPPTTARHAHMKSGPRTAVAPNRFPIISFLPKVVVARVGDIVVYSISKDEFFAAHTLQNRPGKTGAIGGQYGTPNWAITKVTAQTAGVN